MLCPKCKAETPDSSVFCCQCGKKLTTTKKSRTKSRGNGTGTAYKRGSGWVAQVVVGYRDPPPFDPDSPDRRQLIPVKKTKAGFKTKAEALAYCPILKASTPEKVVPALSHYWELYESSELEAVGKSKQNAYRIAWKRLGKLHDYRMDAITVSHLRAAVSESCSTYYTAKDCKSLLSALFRLAAADGNANKDLPSFIILPKHEETERQIFTELEQANLWKLYESGDQRVAPILLMIYSGMMPGELMNLRADQIDLDGRIITGAGMKTAVRKKTPIVLAESIIPVVQDLVDHALPDGRIFNPCDPKTWRDRYYYPVLEAAGCRRLSPYSCRHTTASALAITEGIAPQTVQKVMRWASTRMMDRYVHPDHNAALEAVDTLGRHTAEQQATTDLLPTYKPQTLV